VGLKYRTSQTEKRRQSLRLEVKDGDEERYVSGTGQVDRQTDRQTDRRINAMNKVGMCVYHVVTFT
jgi:hypothetical protein